MKISEKPLMHRFGVSLLCTLSCICLIPVLAILLLIMAVIFPFVATIWPEFLDDEPKEEERKV